jgi:hypothetical protein
VAHRFFIQSSKPLNRKRPVLAVLTARLGGGFGDDPGEEFAQVSLLRPRRSPCGKRPSTITRPIGRSRNATGTVGLNEPRQEKLLLFLESVAVDHARRDQLLSMT